jgi:hypothetical protein
MPDIQKSIKSATNNSITMPEITEYNNIAKEMERKRNKGIHPTP